MFFAKLGKRSLEYIARYSHDQHISLDKAFRQILLLGLSQLEAQISVAARDERKKFIQEHWQLESDKELAIACNCSIDEIRDERSVLGLKRQLGRRTFSHRRDEVNEIIRVQWTQKSDLELARGLGLARGTVACYRSYLGLRRDKRILLPTNPPTLAQDKAPVTVKDSIEDDATTQFIRMHYLTMSDGELGRSLGLNRADVIRRRYMLGLQKMRSQESEGVRLQIDFNALKEAVTNGGLTLTEYMCQKNITVTRERMRQLCDENGIQSNYKTRTPLWYANRVGEPNLANKAWLEDQLREAFGASALGARLGGITMEVIKAQARRLGIDPALLKASIPLIELRCSGPGCGRSFFRKKTLIRNPSQKVYFCNKVCHGKWMATFHRPRKWSKHIDRPAE